MSEIFNLFSLCRAKSCILHFSAKVSLEFSWNLAHFSRNTHPAIWCLTKLEYNGMNFNLISQRRLCLIFLIVQVQEILTILQYCVHLYRNLSIMLRSQLDTSLAFRFIFFLSFCRDKYNGPEEVRCCRIYCGWTVETQLSEELVCKFSIVM